MEKKNLIGPRVRKLRSSKEMSQAALAARCNLLGWDLSRGTLAKIESQVRCISDVEVGLLAKALGVEVGELYRK